MQIKSRIALLLVLVLVVLALAQQPVPSPFAGGSGGSGGGSVTIAGTANQISTSGTGCTAGVSGTCTVAFVASPILPNGTTATTQSQSDNSTKPATTAYTDTAVANATATTFSSIADGATVAFNASTSINQTTTLDHTRATRAFSTSNLSDGKTYTWLARADGTGGSVAITVTSTACNGTLPFFGINGLNLASGGTINTSVGANLVEGFVFQFISGKGCWLAWQPNGN